MLFYNKRCCRTDTDIRGSKQQRCFFATQKNSLSSHRHPCLWLDEDILTLFSSDSVFKMNGEPLTSFKYDHGIHMTTQGIFLPMTFTAYNRMLLQFNLIDMLGIRHFAL